jgi:hypothetical protein
MTVKTILRNGRCFRLGRHRSAPEHIARALKFEAYALPGLPAPPAPPLNRISPLAGVISRLYANDTYGDCTKAGQAHLIGAYTGLANPPAVTFTDQQIVADYMRLTGGEDDGLDLITVLNDWRDNTKTCLLGAQHKIAGYVAVDATNQQRLRQAIWLFDGVYLGLELSDQFLKTMPAHSGFVMDNTGPGDPNDGHCIVGIDYQVTGIVVLTWGMWGVMTWDAVSQYLSANNGGECYAVLTQESIARASQKAPSGFDFAALQADLQAVAA